MSNNVRIEATAAAVWDVLVSPDKLRHWMNGADVRSTWQPGSEITFTGSLADKRYRDVGTVLEVEPTRLLRYSHWSGLSRRPDTPDNRSIIDLRLQPVDGGRGTVLTVTHERLTHGTTARHANFYWSVALQVIKELAEDRARRPIALIEPTD